MKSQGKTKFFQGQGKVSEFCIWSGKFGILLKVGNLYQFRHFKVFHTFIEFLNKKTEK